MTEPSDEARALAYRIDHEHALAGAENREPTYEVACLLDAALADAWDEGKAAGYGDAERDAEGRVWSLDHEHEPNPYREQS